MIKVAVVGATGYAGEEAIKALLNHSQVEITSVSAKVDKPQKIDEIFPEFSGKLELICDEPDFDQIIPNCDLAYLALPHRVSMQMAPKFLKAGKKVIDLSADYRLKDILSYETSYAIKHQDPENVGSAVYGLPEVYREKIKKANLIANPGCYPTSAILGCLPLLEKNLNEGPIIVDAKSGLSGAGREKEAELFAKMKDSFCAYKVDAHQHAPEIAQELSSVAGKTKEIVFAPHLIPIKRGILSTIYIPLNKELSEDEVHEFYNECYQDEPFVKVAPCGEFPQVKEVTKTNFCYLGIKVNTEKKLAIVISVIDNLIKGASGQAVQNMNIMYGFKETEGLL